MGDEMVEMAISLGFSIIGAILRYLKTAGVSEEVIDANWATTKAEYFKRRSEVLPHVTPPTE
jgi:hypothetical protein